LGDFPVLFAKLDELETFLKGLININRQRNLEIKNQIIQELASLVDDTNWKDTGIKIDELKTRWIKTGAVEEHIQAEIEETFASHIKAYYNNKKRFLQKQG